MNATIIAVGDELLSGRVINTHPAYIAERLRPLGIIVERTVTVSDSRREIHKALDYAESDVVFFTGGLGPTRDDLTKESIADYFDLPLKKNERAAAAIERYFSRAQRFMEKNNEKQALFPEGAHVLANSEGTAPGMVLSMPERYIVALPGPRGEMEPMLEKALEHLPLPETALYEDDFLLIGKGESDLESRMGPIYDQHPHVAIAPYAGLGEVRYRFSSGNEAHVVQAMEDFYHVFKDDIVARSDETVEERLIKRLRDEGLTIALVESCTGGLAASRIVDVPGASDVFEEAFVLYSNEMKIRRLGVSPTLLERDGAVSDAAVYEMAYRLSKQSGAGITLSISGIAGPEGGTDEKPVGTVYFGLHSQEGTGTFHRIFSGDRIRIRQKAASFALALAVKAVGPFES